MADILDNDTGKTLTVIDGGMADGVDGGVEPVGRDKAGRKQELTAKQRRFVQGIVAGKNASDAYREAYNTENMNANTVWREASRLMHHPLVITSVKAAKVRQSDAALITAASYRDAIKNRLAEMAGISNPDGPHLCDNDRDRLAAMRMLGQLGDVKAFVDIPDTDTDREDADALMAELEDKLKRAFGK